MNLLFIFITFSIRVLSWFTYLLYCFYYISEVLIFCCFLRTATTTTTTTAVGFLISKGRGSGVPPFPSLPSPAPPLPPSLRRNRKLVEVTVDSPPRDNWT